MTLLACWLLAVGVCDLVRGARETWPTPRLMVAVLAGTTTLVVPLALLTASLTAGLAVAIAVPALLAAWVEATRRTLNGGLPVAVSVVFFVGVVGVALAVSGSLTFEVRDGVQRWYDDLDLPAVHQLAAVTVLLGAGVIVFLMTTSNVIVRMVLGGANVPVESTEKVLRAGRLIGAMERLFIFSLTVGGAPGAAAVVVAAKSLLRFPEVSQRAASRSDPVTEYFLVGSLTSWLLALVFVPLFS